VPALRGRERPPAALSLGVTRQAAQPGQPTRVINGSWANKAIVGPAVVGDQGAVSRGAGEGEQDIDGVGWIEAVGEPEPAGEVGDDAAVTIAAQLLVVCPHSGRVGFMGRRADDVVEQGDPGHDRRVAFGEPADRSLPVASVTHGGIPRLGGRGPRVVLAQDRQLIAGLQELSTGRPAP